MEDGSKKLVVKVGPRLAKFIGAKAERDKKLQAAAMQAEFTLVDTLIILCHLSRDPDAEISTQARKNLIPAARSWWTRPDRPELPVPILHIVTKVIERIGTGDKQSKDDVATGLVSGNVALFGLAEIIQAVDHNSRTIYISMVNGDQTVGIYTENGKVVGAVSGELDGLKALHRAFAWADAHFTYTHGHSGTFENRIKVNTLNLVMDALDYAPDADPFDVEDSWNWRVEGSLAVMNIFELAEVFEMNSKQAICKLERDENEGVLYFNHGRVINATLGSMTGMDAACHLLAWPNAKFRVTRGGDGVDEVIHAGMQNLIIEAMRLLDEGITVSDRIASELAVIDELFEGKDVTTLPLLDKVRIIFGEDEEAREVLEVETHPLIRKAIKVKISKTVQKYLSVVTDHQIRLAAAQGRAPLSTTEKLVLLAYLSHDESPEIQEEARRTLANLDSSTFRKGFGGDLHPSVMDFLVRETIRDESLLKMVCSMENVLEETVAYILETRQTEEIISAVVENRKLMERSSGISAKAWELTGEMPQVRDRIKVFEESMLDGAGSLKVEGNLRFFGLGGLIRAVSSSNRSGTVVLEGAGMTGRVFLDKGKVIGAIWGPFEGRAAIEALLPVKGLRFRFVKRMLFSVNNVDPAVTEEILNNPDSASSYGDGAGPAGRIVTGSPEAMDLFEVLTALEGTPVPVGISIICEEGSGELCMLRHHVVHCYVEGKDSPYKALAAILSWTGSRFLVRYEDANHPHTLDKGVGDFFTE
ncbi:MAG: DUF4388 domain-containing protein, partial [Pseudomonadota bacterium]